MAAMAFAQVFVLCLCASLSGIEGSRTQTKAIQSALEQMKDDGESQSQTMPAAEMQDEQEKSIGDGETLQPGRCTRWCKKLRVGLPIDFEYVRKQTEAKCQEEQCNDCKGGGLFIPDCREKQVAVEAEEKASGGEDDVPQCIESPAEPVQACKLVEGDAELTCTHVNTAWCMPPSRNPGHKYRSGGKMLCCDTEQSVHDSDMADVTTEVHQVKAALENAKVKEEEPPAPVPICAIGHTFEVDSFKRKGKTKSVCRDKDTGKFAKKVCCDAEASKLLKDEEKADELCPMVKKKFCKTSIAVFEKKRHKYPDVPDTFTCKRMYMCCLKGEQCFGPVPNQSWCNKNKTGLDKNVQAIGQCVAVKK